MKFIEGDKIITIGRAGSKCANCRVHTSNGKTTFSFPIWQGKIYVARKNYKGQLKWFLQERVGRTIASKTVSTKYRLEIQNTYNDLPFVDHVTQFSTRGLS